jgi:hypothetical protein
VKKQATRTYTSGVTLVNVTGTDSPYAFSLDTLQYAIWPKKVRRALQQPTFLGLTNFIYVNIYSLYSFFIVAVDFLFYVDRSSYSKYLFKYVIL